MKHMLLTQSERKYEKRIAELEAERDQAVSDLKIACADVRGLQAERDKLAGRRDALGSYIVSCWLDGKAPSIVTADKLQQAALAKVAQKPEAIKLPLATELTGSDPDFTGGSNHG